MNRLDDEILMRRVDGELPPDEAAAVDAAAAADPGTAARLDALRRLRGLAREAFPATADPRDAALAARILAGAPARTTDWTGWLRSALAPRLAPVWAASAAAAFVLGLAVGQLGGRDEGFALAPDGGIADAGLVRVLDRRLAAQGPDAAGRAVGLSFRDAEGRWCRTFAAGDEGVAGLACREADGWRLEALAPFAAATGEVRMASADTPAPVLAAVDALIAGETLDAAAEARARDAGWR